MKRLLFAAALVAVIGLIGCGSAVDDKETSAVNNAQTQINAETSKEAEKTKTNIEAQSSTSAQKRSEEKTSAEKTKEE